MHLRLEEDEWRGGRGRDRKVWEKERGRLGGWDEEGVLKVVVVGY